MIKATMALMEEIIIEWLYYSNFFDLYADWKNEPKLVYVIGETHHCYIGSVGPKGGEAGLARRYEKQYLDRARAIFGADVPENQPAYAGRFISPNNPSPELIEMVEKIIQKEFLIKVGQSAALFTLRGVVTPLRLVHKGRRPQFLNSESKT